jgi:RNA polymerase sigma factor (TIGR02999 family)
MVGTSESTGYLAEGQLGRAVFRQAGICISLGGDPWRPSGTKPMPQSNGTADSERTAGEPMSEVPRILSAIEHGDPHGAAQLLPLVYDELRKLAAQRLSREAAGQTLQPTALVHEAYLRLVNGDETQQWNSRGHFFAAAAEAMRRILVEQARRKKRLKHGGERGRIDIELASLPTRMSSDELLALDEALKKLQQQDPVKAQLVTLRFFGGMTIEQASEQLDISRVTAHRYWVYARAWLYQQIHGSGSGEAVPDNS